jgi:hypothetical protein
MYELHMVRYMGHGNEADFLGVLHIPVRHRSLTPRFEPFRFWLRFEFAEIFVIEKRVGELTRLPVDTILFFFAKLGLV